MMSLRQYMPKSLYARFLLIIIVPMLLVQFVSVYVFYERHWDSMSRNMAHSLSGEIAYIISALQSLPQEQHNNFLTGINQFMYMKAVSVPIAGNSLGAGQARYSDFTHFLQERLPFEIAIYDTDNNDWLAIDVQLSNSILKIRTSQKRLNNPTTYIFILWMTGSALLLTFVAILFLKNQLRAIVRLTEAAENFDRGIDKEDFRPGGATEIRRASLAFIEMRERIKQLMAKRSEAVKQLADELDADIQTMESSIKKMKSSETSKTLTKQIKSLKKTLTAHLDN